MNARIDEMVDDEVAKVGFDELFLAEFQRHFERLGLWDHVAALDLSNELMAAAETAGVDVEEDFADLSDISDHPLFTRMIVELLEKVLLRMETFALSEGPLVALRTLVLVAELAKISKSALPAWVAGLFAQIDQVLMVSGDSEARRLFDFALKFLPTSISAQVDLNPAVRGPVISAHFLTNYSAGQLKEMGEIAATRELWVIAYLCRAQALKLISGAAVRVEVDLNDLEAVRSAMDKEFVWIFQVMNLAGESGPDFEPTIEQMRLAMDPAAGELYEEEVEEEVEVEPEVEPEVEIELEAEAEVDDFIGLDISELIVMAKTARRSEDSEREIQVWEAIMKADKGQTFDYFESFAAALVRAGDLKRALEVREELADVLGDRRTNIAVRARNNAAIRDLKKRALPVDPAVIMRRSHRPDVSDVGAEETPYSADVVAQMNAHQVLGLLRSRDTHSSQQEIILQRRLVALRPAHMLSIWNLAKMAQGLELDCEELGARLLWDQGFQSMNGGGDYRAQVCREVNDRRIAYLRGKGVEADQLQPASELKRVAPTVPDWPNYTEVPFEQFLAFFADRYNEWSGENGARSVPDREKVILREALAHFTLLAVGEDNDSRQFRAVMRDILDTLKGGKVAESDLSKLRTFKTPVFARQN